jgi:threonine dehydrogenase-like Zn-dependent dehydrogenase
MLAVQYHRSIPAYALVRATGGNSSVATSDLSMLHLADVPEPGLLGPGWMRVRPTLSGICGSDTSAITGHASLYLDPLTSYPFVPGHEVVGELDDGTRVVVEPALGCRVRGVTPVCPRCAEGRPGLCQNVTEGTLEVGLQTGYCASTGGGWGEVLVAHESQLHAVPERLSDEAAVLLEPLACCVHAALRGGASRDDVVVVQGAGTIGLLTVAAVRLFTPPKRLIVVAKYPFQREQAKRLGGDLVAAPDEVFQRVRFATQARRLDGMDRPLLLGGADLTFECTGSASGLNDAVRFTRAGGRLVVVGMPGEEKVDWGPIWQRELTVTGAYAYGTEKTGERTFDLAIAAASDLALDQLTGPLFSLGDYRNAIAYALQAGRLDAVKVAFDLRDLRT